ncbi:MAG: SLC13 family permease [Flavobacteriales bacterium]|nr:SLC13 family permease [Flavobacteriales bacterium]
MSKVLIPLSYASILGGCTTLVGTSTNLIVNGMVVEAGLEPLGMFDFTAVGFVMLVIGISYLVIFSNRLPDNETVTNQFVENSRDFVIEMHVQPKSDVVGASVEAAGLRNLDGVYLIEIIRKSQNIYPVGPKEVIRANDVLLFAGNTERVRDLTEEHKGLSLPEACQLPEKDVDNIIEVVISQNSRLAGKKIKATNFRGKYDGVILGVHRNGERLRGKIGKIVLEPGDVLLVLAGKDFLKRMENNPHFYILSNQEEEKQIHSYKAVIFLLGLITAIGTAVLYDISLMVSLSVLLLLCMTLKMIKPSNIRNSIDFNLILIIGLGLALGKAMINSGAAKFITEKGFSMLQDINPWTVLIALFLITNALSSFITGKAAVAIIFPITLLISSKLGVEAKPLILAMTFGAAANFMTPIGYQTNLMVYGPGGYRFTDFFKMGLPLTLIYAFVTATILNYTYY